MKHNIEITHLDSEQHHHCLPPLFNIVIQLAEEYNIPSLRLGNEKIFGDSLFPSWKSIFLASCSPFNKRKILKTDLKYPDNQIGIALTGKMELNTLISLLKNLPSGTTEFCAHPGYTDSLQGQETVEFGRFYINQTRERELEILMNSKVKDAIASKKIKLINYGDLV